MREMGFEFDPSTAGSSVRFDPPNPKDKVCSTLFCSELKPVLNSFLIMQPITFHKRKYSTTI